MEIMAVRDRPNVELTGESDQLLTELAEFAQLSRKKVVSNLVVWCSQLSEHERRAAVNGLTPEQVRQMAERLGPPAPPVNIDEQTVRDAIRRAVGKQTGRRNVRGRAG